MRDDIGPVSRARKLLEAERVEGRVEHPSDPVGALARAHIRAVRRVREALAVAELDERGQRGTTDRIDDLDRAVVGDRRQSLVVTTHDDLRDHVGIGRDRGDVAAAPHQDPTIGRPDVERTIAVEEHGGGDARSWHHERVVTRAVGPAEHVDLVVGSDHSPIGGDIGGAQERRGTIGSARGVRRTRARVHVPHAERVVRDIPEHRRAIARKCLVRDEQLAVDERNVGLADGLDAHRGEVERREQEPSVHRIRRRGEIARRTQRAARARRWRPGCAVDLPRRRAVLRRAAREHPAELRRAVVDPAAQRARALVARHPQDTVLGDPDDVGGMVGAARCPRDRTTRDERARRECPRAYLRCRVRARRARAAKGQERVCLRECDELGSGDLGAEHVQRVATREIEQREAAIWPQDEPAGDGGRGQVCREEPRCSPAQLRSRRIEAEHAGRGSDDDGAIGADRDRATENLLGKGELPRRRRAIELLHEQHVLAARHRVLGSAGRRPGRCGHADRSGRPRPIERERGLERGLRRRTELDLLDLGDRRQRVTGQRGAFDDDRTATVARDRDRIRRSDLPERHEVVIAHVEADADPAGQPVWSAGTVDRQEPVRAALGVRLARASCRRDAHGTVEMEREHRAIGAWDHQVAGRFVPRTGRSDRRARREDRARHGAHERARWQVPQIPRPVPVLEDRDVARRRRSEVTCRGRLDHLARWCGDDRGRPGAGCIGTLRRRTPVLCGASDQREREYSEIPTHAIHITSARLCAASPFQGAARVRYDERMRIWLLAMVVTAALGCEKHKQPRFDGPMPVTFGDCAAPGVAFVSGPRPLPFTPAEAQDAWTDVAATEPAARDTPPPPEVETGSNDESGGTGTAIALDEGKMGKKDSDRAEGQYRMARSNEDQALARAQAIEAARIAGTIDAKGLEQGGAFASLTGTGDISSGFDDSNIYGRLLGNEAGEMNGGVGYGRSGFGPGGGGTGWGTIGTGRYGTIGHGSGTGTGYGVGGGRGGMRGRTAAVPPASIGQPNAQGDLDKAIIRRYIKRNIQKITYCYEKQLLAKPGLAGTVSTQFFITPSGIVATASGSGVDPEVANCGADVIKGIEFPKPKGGGGVQVNYPFTFRPAGQ